MLYQASKDNGKRLRDSLYDALKACDDALSGPTPGTFLSSTNEAGGGAAWQVFAGFTPKDAERLISELLDYLDKTIVALEGDPEDPSTYDDKSVYGAMMSALVPVRRFRNDYTGLRYGAGAYLGL